MSGKRKRWSQILGVSLGIAVSLPLLFGIERSLHVWPNVLDDGSATTSGDFGEGHVASVGEDQQDLLSQLPTWFGAAVR